MKTTFYKKLVPLAMIASLALSGAGSAMAGTGFLTYNGNSIVAFADDEVVSTAAVDLNFGTTNATKTATGAFDYFDADSKVRTIEVEYELTENYTKYIQNTQTGVTLHNNTTNGKVPNQTISEYKKGSTNVWILKLGTDYYECTPNNDDTIEGAYTFDASAPVNLEDYTPVEETPTADTRSLDVEGATKAADIKAADFTFKNGEATIEGIKVAKIEHKMKLKAGVVVEEGKEPTAEQLEIDGDKCVLTIEVAASVANGAISVVYGGIATGSTINYTKNTGAVDTTVEGGAITKYEGDAKNIDLGAATGVTSIAADAFKDCKDIQNVIVPNTITSIGADAFSGCTALDTVTIKGSSKLTTVGNNAFPNNTVVILESGVPVNVKDALEASNANVFDAATAEEGKMLLPAGDAVKFNCVNNSIISTGAVKQTAKLTFNKGTVKVGEGDAATEVEKTYTFGTPGDDEVQVPSTYKWVVATTAGKVSSAAKINKKTQLAGATKFDITGTKANGKFNNTVVLMAVPTSMTKDYNTDKAYAYCTFYIKPAAVTEWANAKTSSAFSAGKEDDTNSPVQKADADGTKYWIAKSDDATGVNFDYATGKSKLNFENWEQVAAAGYTETTVEADAWTLDDGTKVIAPAVVGGKVQYNQVDSKTSFDLTITEGQTFALPIKAKNGADKTLKYEVTDGSGNFTVVNGKVKGITAGEGTIVVTPVADHTVDSAVVNVKVTPKVSKGVANTTSLTLVGTDAQSFRIGANPVSAKNLYYTITDNEKLNITSANGEAKTIGEGESAVKYYSLTNGSDVITVAQKKAGEDGIGTAKTSLDIQYYTIATDADGKETATAIGKKFTVKVNESKTGEYDNVKKFKESAGKLDKVAGVRKLAVPVGVTTYLGLSVTPATANQNFTTTVEGGDATMVGDAFTANEAGTYTVTAKSVGIGADEKTVESTKYEITVYEQGGSIVFDDENYTVVGGFLMNSENADTDSNHTFAPGEVMTFDEPSNDSEDITWTSNNPAGLSVSVANGKMTVVGTQPGTYTVTGKSAKTAQKYTFKVMIDKCNTCEEASPAISVTAATAEALEKGQTVQLNLNVPEGLAGTVKWETADKTVATVSGKGLVKIVNKENKTGTCDITATMTLNDKTGKKVKEKTVTAKCTVSVAPSTVTVTPKAVPAAAKVNTPFKVSATVKNAKADQIVWTSVPAGIKVESGKATIATAGTYEVFANGISAGTVVVSAVTPSSLTVVDGPMNGLSIKDLKNKKVGLQNYNLSADAKDPQREATVYVKAKTDKDDTAADLNDIVWTSSNANAVVVKNSTVGTTNAQYATVTVSVVKDTKYTGKVTLTGVSKNGGKKVSFTVMVNDGATAEAQKVTSATTKATTAAPEPTSSNN